MKIIIPARKGSKGLPGKNRLLFEHTISKIPKIYKKDVIVTTDDEVIIEQLSSSECKTLKRQKALSEDTTSTRDVLQDAIDKYNISEDEQIIMLYLTYPERTWKDIEQALEFYSKTKARSLLCCSDVKVNPFLCMLKKDNYKGAQIIEHNLYRRQDYPECFEISHFISIFQSDELKKLNKNLYNKDTVFYKIKSPVDVDTPKDIEKFYGKDNS